MAHINSKQARATQASTHNHLVKTGTLTIKSDGDDAEWQSGTQRHSNKKKLPLLVLHCLPTRSKWAGEDQSSQHVRPRRKEGTIATSQPINQPPFTANSPGKIACCLCVSDSVIVPHKVGMRDTHAHARQGPLLACCLL